jgi:hypothetical protein
VKKINITKEQIDKWQSSIWYRWVRWYQYTWLGKSWFSIKGGVPSLIRWFKIAWNDRNYDYHFIYTTLRFKLENTLKYIDRHERSVNYKYDVFWMQTCVDLIDKITGDETYELEYSKYKKTNMRFEPIKDTGTSEIHLDILEDNLDGYFEKYPLCHKRAIEYIKNNQSRYTVDHTDRGLVASTMGQLRHDKARGLLFQIMSDKIEHWWD